MSSEPIESVVEVSGLSATFGSDTAIADISFSLKPGTVAALVTEPLGSGALLLDCLCGLCAPSEGSIRIDGVELSPGHSTNSFPVSMVRGKASFPAGVTVGELLGQLALLLGGADAGQLLEDFGLGSVADSLLRDLNAENQHVVRLACSWLGSPKLVVYEGVDRDLSPPRRRLINRLLREKRNTGAAIVFTAGSIDVAEAICNHVLVIKGDKLVACDTPENLILAKENWMRVEVLTDDDLSLEGIVGLDCVNRVVQHGNRYDVFVHNQFDSVRQLLGFLDQEGIAVRDLRTYRSTLSDVVWELL